MHMIPGAGLPRRLLDLPPLDIRVLKVRVQQSSPPFAQLFKKNASTRDPEEAQPVPEGAVVHLPATVPPKIDMASVDEGKGPVGLSGACSVTLTLFQNEHELWWTACSK